MEIREKATEAVKVAERILCIDDINTAAAAYDLATEDRKNCIEWAGYSYGAMIAYTAGYLAGARAQKRIEKRKAARRANAERLQ